MPKSLAVRLTSSRGELLCLHRSRGRVRLGEQLTIPFPDAGQANSQTTQFQQKTASLLKTNGIKNGQVFVSLPREEVILREIQLPAVVEENLRQVLSYQLDRYTPFSRDDAYFDFQITSRNANDQTMTVLLAAVEKRRLQQYLDRLAFLNLTPSTIEVTSTAMLNALCHTPSPRATRAKLPALRVMIDVREDGWEMILAEGSFLRYGRAVANTDDLVTRIGSEIEHAVTAIHRSRDDIGEVVVAQPPARQSGRLTETLRTQLGLHVTPAESPLSGSVIMVGLGLRGLMKRPAPINLLPAPPQYKSAWSRFALTSVLLSLIVFLGALSIVGLTMRDRSTLKTTTTQLATLSPQITAMTALQDEAARLKAQITTIQALNPPALGALGILRELTTIIPENNWLTNLTYKDHSITLVGEAHGSPAHLIRLLEPSAVFYNVQFSEPLSGNEFRIRADVRTHYPAPKQEAR